jgi:hypothetical protein
LFGEWYAQFEALVCDEAFQRGACQDERHQIFLHQAVLSALIASRLEPAQMRILPSEYNYPHNLHQSVLPTRQAKALNDLVCFTYEDRSLLPDEIEDIQIHEPLRSWLAERANSFA